MCLAASEDMGHGSRLHVQCRPVRRTRPRGGSFSAGRAAESATVVAVITALDEARHDQVDGQVIEVLVAARRDAAVARRFLRRALTTLKVRFVWTAVSLTAISLVPPFLSGANAATTTTLLGLYLVAATVVIPTLAPGLRTRTD
jgi:hypothetical protein